MAGEAAYATLAQIRTEIRATSSVDDTHLLAVVRQMTAIIDTYLRANYRPVTFLPRRVTRYYDPCASSSLDLLDFYAEVERVDDVDGTTLTAGTDYRAMPRGETPVTDLARLGGSRWLPSSDDGTVEVTGVLCYHSNYAEAWQAATTITADVNASATTLTVASGAAVSPGALIRIGSEWLTVEAVATNTVTVARGVRGSIAAAHDNADPVEVFVPESAITRACLRWASYVDRRRGAFEVTRFDGTSSVEMPQSMPEEVRDMLSNGGWTFVRAVRL